MRIPPAYLRGIKQSLSFYPRSYLQGPSGSAEDIVKGNIETVVKNIAATIHGFESKAEWYRKNSNPHNQKSSRK
jgi:hypothetical protein